MNKFLHERLDVMTRKIQATENELQGVWFSFEHKTIDLMWANGRIRSQKLQKPLAECPLSHRLILYPHLDLFKKEVLAIADKELKKVGL